MHNAHGDFIWYELLTPDPDAAAAFYGDVVGWAASDAGQAGMDYRILSAGNAAVAGLMALPPGAETGGMRPGWLGYVGVDDVDEAVAKVGDAGGAVHMPAMTMEGVGRMALVADPQGAPFYVMRGASDLPSTSFDPAAVGRCCWNELSTTDQEGALGFYAEQFGWTRGDAMPMGEAGEYRFVKQGGSMIGAVMPRQDDAQPPTWSFCFRVADIDEAVARVTAGGASIVYGPMEVPGGDMVIQAIDPQGAGFMLAATKKQ